MDCLTWLQEEYFHIATDVIDFDYSSWIQSDEL